MKVYKLQKIFNQLGIEETQEEYKMACLEVEYIIQKASQKVYQVSCKKACFLLTKI